MSRPEMRYEDDKVYAKCRCCGCWVDVTSMANSPYVDMDKWMGCDKCESGFLSDCYGPRDELSRAALDHRGRP